jgi:putative ABC transport system permease protein
MRLVRIALADLFSERVHLACAVATIVGVVTPLVIMLGVKTGVFAALMDDLRADPEILRVTIPGDRLFGPAEADEVRRWPETGFVALNTRAIARRLNVRREGGDRIRGVALVPTGAGDPLLPAGPAPAGLQVAASEALARQTGLAPGDRLAAVVARGDPPTDRMSLTLDVVAVLPRATLEGESLLMAPDTMDRIEAFYDGYALPDWGAPGGRPLAERTLAYESLRVYARDLTDVAALEARLRARFDVAAISRAGQVEGVLALGRNLDRALALVAAAALAGLFAALTSSFWAAVQRKRTMLATLALLGVAPAGLALAPVVQAAATAAIGAAASLALAAPFALAAEAAFGGALPTGGRVVRLDPATLALVAGGVVTLAVAAAFLAARAAARLDPAIVIREGSA